MGRRMAPALWPAGAPGSNARAVARSASAIMHAQVIPPCATDCPMNIRRRTDASRMTEGRARRRRRRRRLVGRLPLQRSGGPFMFGTFTIADAMYAPVVTRFVTYAIPRSQPMPRPTSRRFQADPHVAAWIAAAQAETRHAAPLGHCVASADRPTLRSELRGYRSPDTRLIHGTQGRHPHHSGLPEEGDHVPGRHHADGKSAGFPAGRRRVGATLAGSKSTRSRASRPVGSSWAAPWRTSCRRGSCRCARRASCPTRSSLKATNWNMA